MFVLLLFVWNRRAAWCLFNSVVCVLAFCSDGKLWSATDMQL